MVGSMAVILGVIGSPIDVAAQGRTEERPASPEVEEPWFSANPAYLQGMRRSALSLGADAGAQGLSAIVIGFGMGVFLVDGLEVGLDVDQQIALAGTSFAFTRLSPQIRYIVPYFGTFAPYLGGFYRRYASWLDGTVKGKDSFGGRVGAIFQGDKGAVGVGITYEWFVRGCDSSSPEECPPFAPEVFAFLSF